MADTHLIFTGKPCKRGHIGARRADNGDCVQCARERVSQWQRDNPDKVNARDKRYRERYPGQARPRQTRWLLDPANLKKQREWSRRWRAANPEAARLATRNWYRADLPANRERKRQWSKENPEAARAINRRRRARLNGAEGSHTEVEIIALFEQQGGRCAAPHCNADLHDGITEDHKIPISRGGSDDIDNIQLMCRSCNSSKGDRTMEEWANDHNPSK